MNNDEIKRRTWSAVAKLREMGMSNCYLEVIANHFAGEYSRQQIANRVYRIRKEGRKDYMITHDAEFLVKLEAFVDNLAQC